jgi:hypothetical protein
MNLSEIAVRNTAAVVASRMSVIRAKKNDKEAVSELVELVNELIDDKMQLVSIARSFEDELVAQRISDEDIKYITTQLLPLVEKLIESGGDADEAVQQQIETLKSLLTPDFLKILQLVGFNYRQAVGGPLTSVVERLILNLVPESDGEMQALEAKRQIAYFDAVSDPEARAFLQQA